jgi:hypothetical protein
MLYGKRPWKGLKDIRKNPLKFDTLELKDDTKDLISQCLRQEEVDRISWRDLYNHPIFEGKFDEKIKKY